MTDLKTIKNSCYAVKLKSLQNLGTSGYFLACTIFRTSFCWREVHMWKISTYNPKNREYWWPCCGSPNTWDAKTSCQITKYCNFLTFTGTHEKKADEETTLFHDGICHDCDIAWCFRKNVSWDTIIPSSSGLYPCQVRLSQTSFI